MSRKNPRLYEINTVQWLSGLAQKYRKRLTIGAVPDAEWDGFKRLGFDYVWLMGIWKRSKEGLRIFRNGPEWPAFREHLDAALPGWKDADITGSPYSIASYEPDPLTGTWDDLRQARASLHKRGMGLVLDFVPNHTAPDHPWAAGHPDYFFLAERSSYEKNPALYSKIDRGDGAQYIARGKDPYFPPWSDTIQLNYFNPALREALIGELEKIAGYCDGLRCDMAMLVLNDIFARNWGEMAESTGAVHEMPGEEFWRQARRAVPGLMLIAEAYWDTEWRLMELGFDYVYDKILYDRLRNSPARDIKLHLGADAGYQEKLVRFIENHDEPRGLAAFGPDKLRAAAVLFSTLPGMKLYHHGQLEGWKTKMPVQLARCAPEQTDKDIRAFYERLLAITGQDVFHGGRWRLKDVLPFAGGSHQEQELIAYTWKTAGRLKLVVVNLGRGLSQGIVPLADELGGGKDCLLTDELNGRRYSRRAADMIGTGLHVVLDGYQAHIFDIEPISKSLLAARG